MQLLKLPLESGRPWPLGATPCPDGINFVLFSAHAERVVLCLFDETGIRELAQYELLNRQGDLWYGFLPAAKAGLVYGYRVWGPYQPERGHLFNPNKVLLDPYARDVVGQHDWRPEHLGYAPAGQISTIDNAAWALKGRVLEPDTFCWGEDHRPSISASQRIIYEAHVKGLTQLHPKIPLKQRGTYTALGHPTMIQYLHDLGVTSLSLLPVHYYLDEIHLNRAGLHNYWGYNPINFFTPTDRYWRPGLVPAGMPDNPKVALQLAIKALHAAGIEVILDVVYNHSAEGDARGPTLTFRGLDHANYYWVDPTGECLNWSGCGNTLNLQHPRVMQLILDSMRYWVNTFHIDGFRFDLAPILSRTVHGFDPDSAFMRALKQDPVLASVVLIAEPWDLGWGGYQLGHFPPEFLEWNDRFRDTVRQYWLRGTTGRGELARCLTASSDIFRHHHRRPSVSVNYIAVHDGFTLADLVSYQHKHNETNGEDNRDGRDNNFSVNCGTEGPSDDPAVQTERQRLQKALLATLLLAQGTPLLQAGDEWGRSQRGNNNAYCQDNTLTWLDWESADEELLGFTRQLTQLRQNLWQPYQNWLHGRAVGRRSSEEDEEEGPRLSSIARDIIWLAPRGHVMTIHDWHDPTCHALGALVTNFDPPSEKPSCNADRLNSLLFLFNPHRDTMSFQLPEANWQLLLNSSAEEIIWSRAHVMVPAQAVVVFGLSAGEPFPAISYI